MSIGFFTDLLLCTTSANSASENCNKHIRKCRSAIKSAKRDKYASQCEVSTFELEWSTVRVYQSSADRSSKGFSRQKLFGKGIASPRFGVSCASRIELTLRGGRIPATSDSHGFFRTTAAPRASI